MLINLWNKKYSFELINRLTQTATLGLILVNILAPLAVAYILYDFIEHSVLGIWLSLHFVSFFVRLILNAHMIKLLKKKSQKVHFYLKFLYVISFLTTVLYGYIIWMSVLHNVPDSSVFLIGIIISGLATGSLAVLGSIFTAYMIFMTSNFIFLISALLYHGDNIFQLYALIIFSMMGIFSLSGYKHYEAMRNISSLDSTFNLLYENSSNGVVIFQENKFISLNKAMQDLFKYENKDAFINAGLRKLSPHNQPDGHSSMKKMVEMIRYTFKEGYKAFEWLHKDREGKEFWCEIVLTKINLNDTDLIYGVWRDISDKKELELLALKEKEKVESLNVSLEKQIEEAVALNREKDKQMLHQSRLAQMGEMISMIAHQWRQPLNAISSAGALINLKAQLGTLDKDTAISISKDIENYTQHLSATIDDFRNFFKQNKEKEMTNLTYLVKSVLSVIRITLENKNIEIIEELECNDSFLSYSNELKQVIINLVKNAQDILLEKKIENPFIKLKSYESEGKYILEVCDNGGGIDSEVMEHIFNPYFSTKLKKDGTGLGLYMSKTIVEDHCLGRLSCYNTDVGVCFKIELPNA